MNPPFGLAGCMINLLIGAICIFVQQYRSGRPWLVYGAAFHLANAAAYALTIPYDLGAEMAAHMHSLSAIPITMVLASEVLLVPATVLALYGRWLPPRNVAAASLVFALACGLIAWILRPMAGYTVAHIALTVATLAAAVFLLRGPTAFYRVTGLSLLARGIYALALIWMAMTGAPAWVFGTALLINLVFICLTGLGMVLIELDDARARIAEADRAKTQFIANMSHELRTPLNAIIGFSDMMAGGHMPLSIDRCQNYAGDILVSGRHLLSMINQLLDMASIEARKERFTLEVLDLGDIIPACIAMASNDAAGKQIRLLADLPAVAIDLKADRRAVQQILLCLLGNAVKFSPTGSAINLVLAADPATDWVKLTVRDQGPGIDPVHQRSIFEPFYQAQETYSRSQGGVGLGLAITKRLVECLDGRIEVESQLGQGSSFIVTLPRRRQLAPGGQAARGWQFWRRSAPLSSVATDEA
jgi:signal transduction histidine kinase